MHFCVILPIFLTVDRKKRTELEGVRLFFLILLLSKIESLILKS